MPSWPTAHQPPRPQPQATPWQAPMNPRLAAGPGTPPTKARGVAPEPVSAKFVLPSPESLGVSTHLQSAPQAAAQVDWNTIQARMDRLGVLRYQKDRLPAGGVRVLLLLPTTDASKAQPVEAQASTEADAIVLALNAAEAWMHKK